MAVLLSFMSGCGLLSQEVSGSVFVVNDQHRSTKLALITVSVVDREQLRELLRRRKNEWVNGAGKVIASERERVDRELDQASKAYAAAQGYAEKYAARRDVEQLTERMLELYEKSPFDPPLTYYFSQLPKPADATTTDADGRFSVKVPRGGRHVLCALATFPEGRAERTIVWVCDPPKGSASRAFDLSSDNAAGESDLARLINSSER